MGRVLRVFDFDDTLAKSTAYIYVTHKDGTETTLDPAQYAKYKPQRGDEFDFRDFFGSSEQPLAVKPAPEVQRLSPEQLQKNSGPMLSGSIDVPLINPISCCHSRG